MVKFPKIQQLRHVVELVRYNHLYKGKDELGNSIYREPSADDVFPTLTFHGTVKLHGSNAGIRKESDGFYPQSRNRDLTPTSDNMGFAKYVANLPDDLLPSLMEGVDIIYGEWCGPGVQNGVALNQLSEKIFVVFAAKAGGLWVSNEKLAQIESEENGIFNILNEKFPKYEIQIDFNDAWKAAKQLGDLTLPVGESCPFGKALEVEGAGEGIVWTCSDIPGSRFWFKTKTEHHQERTTKAEKPSIAPEVFEDTIKFAYETCSEARLQKGIDYLKEDHDVLTRKQTGIFIKWITADIAREEQDTIAASSFEWKAATGFIGKNARNWYFKYLEDFT